MKTYKNQCYNCAVPSYPCIGDLCPNRHIPVYKCDICGSSEDVYTVDEDVDFCEHHMEEYLKELFEDLSLSERIEILQVKTKKRG